jgi:hypothetical protein
VGHEGNIHCSEISELRQFALFRPALVWESSIRGLDIVVGKTAPSADTIKVRSNKRLVGHPNFNVEGESGAGYWAEYSTGLVEHRDCGGNIFLDRSSRRVQVCPSLI